MRILVLLSLFLFPLFAEGGDRFFVYGEALWLHPSPQDAFVASELHREVAHPTSGEDFLYGKVHSKTRLHGQPEKWSWGYRVGVGYRPPCFCSWDWFIEWTSFEPHTRNREDARPLRKNKKENDCDRKVEGDLIPHTGLSLLNDMILPSMDGVYPTDRDGLNPFLRSIDADEVVGYWKLKWNVLDFAAGRTLCLADCVHFRPFAGVRFARIKQRHHIKSQGRILENELFLPQIEEFEVGHFFHQEWFRQEFKGVGPRVGFDTEWQLGCCWGLYGNVAASLLYGDVETSDRARASRSEIVESEEDEKEPLDFNDCFQRKTHSSRTLTDLQIGIFFRQNGYRHQYSLTVKLGWEHHYFFNSGVTGTSFSNALLSPSGNMYVQTNHDLSTQGATIFVGIDF